MQTETICDIPIYSGTKDDVLLEVHTLLKTNGQHIITTPNPEMLVHAYKDTAFKEILQNSSLAVCDGGGITLMSRGAVPKFSGVDLMQAICKIAADKSLRIYILGSGDCTTVTQAADNLRSTYLNLSIAGIHAGPTLTDIPDSASLDEQTEGINDKVIADILEKKPDILFVGFGHSKQEKWIATHLKQLPSVKIAMGVGGSIDFIAGKIARAPKILQTLHLEWLLRLIKQPKRIKRILTAVFIFPYYYVTKK